VHALSSCYHIKAQPIAHKFRLHPPPRQDRPDPSPIIPWLYQRSPRTVATPRYETLLHPVHLYPPPALDLPSFPQVPTVDTEPKASAAQSKELQVAVGYLLYYGRTVDARILPATCALASDQATASLGTLKRLDRLLGYVSAHRNGTHIYRLSDMVLTVFTDASYLSRPRAGSIAG
jgi:hypothetical protein